MVEESLRLARVLVLATCQRYPQPLLQKVVHQPWHPLVRQHCQTLPRVFLLQLHCLLQRLRMLQRFWHQRHFLLADRFLKEELKLKLK